MYSSEKISVKNPDEIEKRLRLLHRIVSQKSLDLDEHLNQALKLTTKLLGMEVGIISSISGSEYTIVNHFSKNGSELSNGQVCNLENTFCSITLDRNNTVAIDDVEKSPYSRHPCFEPYELQCYFGIPIYIDDELFGTLNFSSSKPKDQNFLEADKTLIKLLSEWVSSVIRRKRIEQSYKESERLYRLISTNSHDLICLHDPDGTYRFVSPSSKNITGYHPSELLGKSPYDFFHPDDLKRIQEESHIKALENDTVQSMQYRFRTKSGEYIWLDTATQPVTENEGEVSKLQTTSREITERKKLEILFSEAQEMAHVGGWELKLGTDKLVCTDEVYRIHEKPLNEEFYLEEALDYYPGEAKERIQEAMEFTMETGKKYDVTLPFVTAKGNHIWVRAIGQAIFADGEPYKLRGTFQDVTLQKENEQKIKEQNKKLKNLTATRDKLYSIIGHDLKNTFFGLFGLIGIMKDDSKSESQSQEEMIEQYELLHSTTKNAYQLFENLLDWIKVQRSELSPVFNELNISELIEESVSVHQVMAKNKNIDITTDIKDSPKIAGDSEMLKTVIRNLISNAIKFSNPDSTVQVLAMADQEQIILKVKDSGIGMSDKIKETLFDPANRPKRHGTKSERGTGLGLLLCKEFIELHKGKIDVKSEEGKGSEFIITLPKTR